MIIHTCYSPVKKIFFKIGVQGTLKCPKQQIKIRVFGKLPIKYQYLL